LQIDEAYDTFTIISGREEEDTELVEKVNEIFTKSRLVTILKATVSTLCCWNITTTPNTGRGSFRILSIYPMMFAQPITLQTKKLNLKSMMKLKSLQMTFLQNMKILFRSPSSC